MTRSRHFKFGCTTSTSCSFDERKLSMNSGDSEVAPARSKYRNVTYVVQTSVLAEDNNYDFHRNVAIVIHGEIERRCTNVHITGINVQAKNFHLWPRKTAPGIRHSEEEQFQARLFVESRETILTQVKTMVDEALVKFGLYHYYDKDPHEVMAVNWIVVALQNMTAEEAKTLLLEVLDLDAKERGRRKGIYAILVRSILVDLQGQPNDWFQTLMENKHLAGPF
jgi:hypothetical protein